MLVRHLTLLIGLLLGSAYAGRAGAQPTKVQPAPTPAANRIEAEMVNLRNSTGLVRCALFASPDGFPREGDKAIASAATPIADQRASCIFNNPAPGTYAIAILHDENENDQMDYDFLGFPLEGYGFSNNASGIIGPPSFEAASFVYSSGTLILPISLHY